METCEHSSLLLCTGVRLKLDKPEYFEELPQIIETSEFTPAFRSDSRCYMVIERVFGDVGNNLGSLWHFHVKFCVNGGWDDDMLCYLWTDGDTGSVLGTKDFPIFSEPGTFPSLKIISKNSPVCVIYEIFVTKCSACLDQINKDYQLRKELVHVINEYNNNRAEMKRILNETFSKKIVKLKQRKEEVEAEHEELGAILAKLEQKLDRMNQTILEAKRDEPEAQHEKRVAKSKDWKLEIDQCQTLVIEAKGDALEAEHDELAASLAKLKPRESHRKEVVTADTELKQKYVFSEAFWDAHRNAGCTNLRLEVEGEIIKIHSIVLFLHSQSNLLEQLKLKSFTGEMPLRPCKFVGVKAAVVWAMVQFLYLQQVYVYEGYVLELYELASFLVMTFLQKKCVDLLQTNMSKETAPEILMSAVKNEDQSLARIVIEFAERSGGKKLLLLSDSLRILRLKDWDFYVKVRDVLFQ